MRHHLRPALDGQAVNRALRSRGVKFRVAEFVSQPVSLSLVQRLLSEVGFGPSAASVEHVNGPTLPVISRSYVSTEFHGSLNSPVVNFADSNESLAADPGGHATACRSNICSLPASRYESPRARRARPTTRAMHHLMQPLARSAHRPDDLGANASPEARQPARRRVAQGAPEHLTIGREHLRFAVLDLGAACPARAGHDASGAEGHAHRPPSMSATMRSQAASRAIRRSMSDITVAIRTALRQRAAWPGGVRTRPCRRCGPNRCRRCSTTRTPGRRRRSDGAGPLRGGSPC